ncbi:hypothetical protein KIPB_009687 [Kipferlia bialata]|uniref:Uncharacterized protein n=1 Tax=Kipferlia bialata TaxID=797122 RepID=A0A9K3GLR2_9EUKA|nr:hypothetical protein KIPB_009687 [Kipferlia bialata]|eukprot:g9687.t1
MTLSSPSRGRARRPGMSAWVAPEGGSETGETLTSAPSPSFHPFTPLSGINSAVASPSSENTGVFWPVGTAQRKYGPDSVYRVQSSVQMGVAPSGKRRPAQQVRGCPLPCPAFLQPQQPSVSHGKAKPGTPEFGQASLRHMVVELSRLQRQCSVSFPASSRVVVAAPAAHRWRLTCGRLRGQVTLSPTDLGDNVAMGGRDMGKGVGLSAEVVWDGPAVEAYARHSEGATTSGRECMERETVFPKRRRCDLPLSQTIMGGGEEESEEEEETVWVGGVAYTMCQPDGEGPSLSSCVSGHALVPHLIQALRDMGQGG